MAETKTNDIAHDREVWKVALDTQMHFNELLIKSRTTVVSIALASIGATAIALKETTIRISIFGQDFHIGVIILALGVCFLFVQFLIDYLYYLPLLLGAVDFTEKLDEKYENEPNSFGLSSAIKRKVSRKRTNIILFLYYVIPILFGILLIIFIGRNLTDDKSPTSETGDVVNKTVEVKYENRN